MKMKDAILEIKTNIKKLAEEQRVLKPQRKTVYLTRERIVDPITAAIKVGGNKTALHCMYIAYGIMRGGKQHPNCHKGEGGETRNLFSLTVANEIVESYNEKCKEEVIRTST